MFMIVGFLGFVLCVTVVSMECYYRSKRMQSRREEDENKLPKCTQCGAFFVYTFGSSAFSFKFKNPQSFSKKARRTSISYGDILQSVKVNMSVELNTSAVSN